MDVDSEPEIVEPEWRVPGPDLDIIADNDGVPPHTGLIADTGGVPPNIGLVADPGHTADQIQEVVNSQLGELDCGLIRNTSGKGTTTERIIFYIYNLLFPQDNHGKGTFFGVFFASHVRTPLEAPARTD
jgi:hypothetical protein